MMSKPQRKIRTLKAEKAKAERKLNRLGVAVGAAKRRRDRNIKRWKETGDPKFKSKADRAERQIDSIRRRRKKVMGVILHIVDRLRFWRNRREKLEDRQPNWNGHPPLQNKYLRALVVRVNKAGGYVTATSDGTHTPGSWHYKLKAVDWGWIYGRWGEMEAFQRAEYNRGHNDPSYYELIGPSNSHNLKYGQQWYLREGEAVETAHDNHGHSAHA